MNIKPDGLVSGLSFTAARLENQRPQQYRLCKRSTETVLQGFFVWTRGYEHGGEWRDIPTVSEEPMTHHDTTNLKEIK